ncbi:MAG TPA: molybdopterin-dependent oxidoreductase, partial [Armatimonadota bacterium]|nr:molybdopterin-dependent oxidoreductase [Armatimonadota bacterium]
KAFTAALQKLDMLVVQDHILTETARYAHVVLPSSTFAETEGTFTNTERRIQRINPAIRRVGNSKADTDIIIEAASLAGADFNYSKVEEILTEISNTVPQYQGVTFDAIGPFGRYLGDLK